MKKLLAILTLVLILTVSTACSSPPDAAEIRPAAEALIEASYEINNIFFGEGLPAIERDSEFAIENHVYYMDEEGNYDYIAEDCPYQTTDQIKAAAEQVYSADYLASLYETMFVGVADEHAGMLYARYLDTDEGLKKSNIHESMIAAKRVYDYDSMTIVKPSNSKFVNVEFDTHLEGESEIMRVRLTLVKEESGWRLDSPTY
ncbi:MAG: hypothetical protein IJX53_08085 [Clostridia bacterium]|nr:hypothetical protein [Clostridia bacterium]